MSDLGDTESGFLAGRTPTSKYSRPYAKLRSWVKCPRQNFRVVIRFNTYLPVTTGGKYEDKKASNSRFSGSRYGPEWNIRDEGPGRHLRAGSLPDQLPWLPH